MNGDHPDTALAANTIAHFEGFRSHPYQDQVGVWTIGYGTIRYPDGTRVGEHDPAVTETQALEYLQHELEVFANTIWHAIKREPTPNQWAAILSLAYNMGGYAIAESTLMREFNAGHISEAAGQFLRWTRITVNGKHVISRGLENRRQAERELFLKP